MPPLPQRARARKPCAVKHVQRPQPSPPNQTQTARSGSAVRRVLLPAGLSAAAGSGATTRGAAECAGRARRGPIAAVRGPAAKAMPGRRGRMALRPAGALRCKCPMHHREPSTVHGAGRAARARAGRAALVWLWAHHACGEAAALGSFQAEESPRLSASRSLNGVYYCPLKGVNTFTQKKTRSRPLTDLHFFFGRTRSPKRFISESIRKFSYFE